MLFFFPAGKGKDTREGIAEDALEGAEWTESREPICIFKLLGTGHPQNVPKPRVCKNAETLVHSGLEACHAPFFTHLKP